MPMRPRSLRTTALRATLLALTVLTIALPAAPPAAAQPVFVGVETNNNGDTSGSLSVPVPAGLSGDLLLAVVAVYINPATSTPAGFTPVPGFGGFNQAICDSGDGAGIRCQVAAFWKIADGSESSVSWNFGPNIRTAVGGVLRYRDTHPTDPIGATADANGTGTTVTAPSVHAAEDGSRIVRVAASDAAQSRSVLLHGPPTVRWSRGSADNLNSIVEVITGAASDAPQALAGPTGTATWTSAAPEQWLGGTIVIRPDPGVVDTDLAVAKSAAPPKVNPGGVLTYTVVVSNHGPADVTGAAVSDGFAAGLTCTWTCSATGASACGAAAGSGDIAETVDLAVGDDLTFTASCTVDGAAAGSLGNSVSVAVPAGFHDTEAGNDTATTTTPVNRAPVAACQDVELVADATDCRADVTGSAAFDGGSGDPDGDLPLSFDHAPAGPYGLGTTAVTLTVTDALGRSDSCAATVTVADEAAPVIRCNAPPTITPPDAPVSFTATATDACGAATAVVAGFECFKRTRKGRRVDKGGSCVVQVDGATVTVLDSGGVGDHIVWRVTAEDGSGNTLTQTCAVAVTNPGNAP